MQCDETPPLFGRSARLAARMIQFCLPPAADAAGGIGRWYATHMVQALHALGHGAAVMDRVPPAGRRIIDGLLLPSIPPEQLSGAIGLLHHAASRPAGASAPSPELERALHERLPRLHRVVCTSQSTADRILASFGVSATVIPPGADRHPPATPLTGPVSVVSAGVLTPRKGHDLLLEALKPLSDLDWTLTIAGHDGRDPAWADALERSGTAPGLAGRVHVIRQPDRATLDTLMASAGLFALLTRWEGYPAAIAEALCRSVPVVTTEAGAAALPLGPLLVDPADIPTVSKVLRRVLCDAALRQDLATAAARAAAALPDWPTQAAAFARAIDGSR